MKNLRLSIFLLFIYSYTDAQVITVDNTGNGAQYDNLQEAIDAASAGDTLYVAGSNANYGGIAIDKKLTLFGNGYLDDATNKSTQLTNVTLVDIAAAGTEVAGFKLNIFDANNVQLDDVKLTDCWITTSSAFRGTNLTIEGNLITGAQSINFSTTTDVAKINNNIFYGRIDFFRTAQSTVENNVFINNTSIAVPFTNSINFSRTNNIYFGFSSSQTGCPSCPSNNELFYHHDGSNYVGSNPLFVNPGTLNTSNNTPFDPMHDFSLQAGSPAIGAGQNGFDQGAYGGPSPFVSGGLAPIPRITSFTTSTTTISPGSTISVTIQASSQQ